jgi:hypothetical protein
MMTTTVMVIEMSVQYVHLTRLIAREYYIKFTGHESTKTYIVTKCVCMFIFCVGMIYKHGKTRVQGNLTEYHGWLVSAPGPEFILYLEAGYPGRFSSIPPGCLESTLK